MLEKLAKHINVNFPFLKGKKLLIAVSGGVDSMVAASILHKLSFKIALAHCNFKLRGEASDLDEQLVRNWANTHKTTCFITSFDTEAYAKRNKISIQMAARDLRYQWFDTLLIENVFDYIITAHHANDNLETVLFNLTRGTGFKGLLGIPKQNGKIVRPFLNLEKKEIIAFADEHKIIWREDNSNVSDKYARNKIRHQVIPVLQSLNPELIKSFTKSLTYLKGQEQIIKDRLIEVKKDLFKPEEDNVISINIEEVLKLNNSNAYLYELLKDFGFTAWADIADLLKAQTGKQIFSPTHRLIKNRAVLLLSSLEKEVSSTDVYSINNFEKTLDFEGYSLKIKEVLKDDFIIDNDKNTIFVDNDKIKQPLEVRKWQKGDYFYPLGMQGKKKISDFYKDQKMSLLDKEKIGLLCSDNNIVWVIGKRLDNRFKITENTTKILKINIQ